MKAVILAVLCLELFVFTPSSFASDEAPKGRCAAAIERIKIGYAKTVVRIYNGIPAIMGNALGTAVVALAYSTPKSFFLNPLHHAISILDKGPSIEAGSKFEQILESLPRDFHNWDQWFGQVVITNQADWLEWNGKDPSLKEGGVWTPALVNYQLTPKIIMDSIAHLNEVFNNQRRQIKVVRFGSGQRPLPKEDPSAPIVEFNDGHSETVSLNVISANLRILNSFEYVEPAERYGSEQGMSLALTKWILGAAEHIPHLVPGYKSFAQGGRLVFVQDKAL